MDFKLPEIGEGVQEGELISWLVKPGDSVEIDQALLEIMTDKATVEIPSPVNGSIKELKFAEGDMLPVGDVIMVIEESASKKVETEEKKSAPPAEVQAESKAPETKVPAQVNVGQSTQTQSSVYEKDTAQFLKSSDVPAAPIVRAMAAKQGVDLSLVQGTGGLVGETPRVLEKDLLNYLNASSSLSPSSSVQSVGKTNATPAVAATPATTKSLPSFQAASSGNEIEEVPLRGLRRLIAQGMVKSKFTAPHFSYVDDFECSSLIDMRKQAKEIAGQYGVKFSYLPFIVKAVVAALKEFPVVNASLKEEGNKSSILYKKFYHIGIAVATENGLIVPVVKNADQKSMLQIASEINDLSQRTREGNAKSDELKGSTFTITSMGNIGGQFATPIINYPEVAIMGVYKIQKKPVVKNEQIVVGNTMTLSLSCDHRVVDGAVAGYFCNAVIERLANPAKLLLEMGL